MKVGTHPGGTRVSAHEVRRVLRFAREYSGRQWAEHFNVSLRTIRTWLAQGMVLDLWRGPTTSQWRQVKAEASHEAWEVIRIMGPKP